MLGFVIYLIKFSNLSKNIFLKSQKGNFPSLPPSLGTYNVVCKEVLSLIKIPIPTFLPITVSFSFNTLKFNYYANIINIKIRFHSIPT